MVSTNVSSGVSPGKSCVSVASAGTLCKILVRCASCSSENRLLNGSPESGTLPLQASALPLSPKHPSAVPAPYRLSLHSQELSLPGCPLSGFAGFRQIACLHLAAHGLRITCGLRTTLLFWRSCRLLRLPCISSNKTTALGFSCSKMSRIFSLTANAASPVISSFSKTPVIWLIASSICEKNCMAVREIVFKLCCCLGIDWNPHLRHLHKCRHLYIRIGI